MSLEPRFQLGLLLAMVGQVMFTATVEGLGRERALMMYWLKPQ